MLWDKLPKRRQKSLRWSRTLDTKASRVYSMTMGIGRERLPGEVGCRPNPEAVNTLHDTFLAYLLDQFGQDDRGSRWCRVPVVGRAVRLLANLVGDEPPGRWREAQVGYDEFWGVNVKVRRLGDEDRLLVVAGPSPLVGQTTFSFQPGGQLVVLGPEGQRTLTMEDINFLHRAIASLGSSGSEPRAF